MEQGTQRHASTACQWQAVVQQLLDGIEVLFPPEQAQVQFLAAMLHAGHHLAIHQQAQGPRHFAGMHPGAAHGVPIQA